LTEYLIGTGGWAYFQIPGVHPLVAYSKAFNFVEVNSTFYELPSLKEAEKWRKLVPPTFQFTVRANKAITHKCKLQPTQEAFETFEKMRQICTIRIQREQHQKPSQLSILCKSRKATACLGNQRNAIFKVAP